MSSVPPGAALHFAPAGAFAQDVTRRIRDEFRRSGERRFGDVRQWLYAAGCAGAGLTFYIVLLTDIGGVWAATGCIAGAAFCAFMLIVQLGHDAAHGSLSARPWLNRLIVFVTFA